MGYKLVPVELLDRALLSIMEQGFDCDGLYELVHIQKLPPQPIYNESKERELFEAFYSERAKTLPLPLGSPIRYGGGQYINDFALFGWMVWFECAQSRAKSGEVGHA